MPEIPCGAIYVQGCARSGNTLMRELCGSGFAHTQLVQVPKEQSECSLEFLLAALKKVRRRQKDAILVGSRDKDASLGMDPALLHAHPEVRVVWMLRHPFDVLTSKHAIQPGAFYVEPERFIESLRLYQRYKTDPQVTTVRYEDLIGDPEGVQKKLAAALGLQATLSFREGHSHFSHNEKTIRALHSIRPIDARSIAKWRTTPGYAEYLREVVAKHAAILELAKEGAYDVSFDGP